MTRRTTTDRGASPDPRIFSSRDVARIAQVTPRQLQWWDERNLISPRHQSRRRLYLPEEVIEIMVIAELRRKGVSLQKSRRILKLLQQEMRRRLPKVASRKLELYAASDGKSVYLEEDRDRLIDLLKKARHAMYLVSVSDQMKRLASEKPTLSSRQLDLW